MGNKCLSGERRKKDAQVKYLPDPRPSFQLDNDNQNGDRSGVTSPTKLRPLPTLPAKKRGTENIDKHYISLT